MIDTTPVSDSWKSGPPFASSQPEAVAAIASPLNKQTLIVLTAVRLWVTLALALLALSFDLGASPAEMVQMLAALGFYMLSNFAHGFALRRDRAVHATGALTLVGEVAMIAVLASITGGVYSPFLVMYALPTLEGLYFYTTGIAFATAVATWLSYVAVAIGSGVRYLGTDSLLRPKTLVITVTTDAMVSGILLMGVFLALIMVFGRALLNKLSTVEGVLAQTIDALQSKNNVLEELTITDPLTQLRNRRYFIERLRTEFEFWHSQNRTLRRGIAEDETFYVVVIDIDDFKQINDRHGHLIGDVVLRAVGKSFFTILRDHDEAARLGGDEFALILRRLRSADVQPVLERLKAITESEIFKSTGQSVSLSIGAVSGTLIDDAERALDLADRAMYTGKRQGKGRIIIADGNPAPSV